MNCTCQLRRKTIGARSTCAIRARHPARCAATYLRAVLSRRGVAQRGQHEVGIGHRQGADRSPGRRDLRGEPAWTGQRVHRDVAAGQLRLITSLSSSGFARRTDWCRLLAPDEALDPVGVAFFGAWRVVFALDRVADLIEQLLGPRLADRPGSACNGLTCGRSRFRIWHSRRPLRCRFSIQSVFCHRLVSVQNSQAGCYAAKFPDTPPQLDEKRNSGLAGYADCIPVN